MVDKASLRLLRRGTFTPADNFVHGGKERALRTCRAAPQYHFDEYGKGRVPCRCRAAIAL